MLLLRPVEEAEGPYDAGYLTRLAMTFHPVEEPITEPVAELGGEPLWLDEPCWPVHPRTVEPLDFIGQSWDRAASGAWRISSCPTTTTRPAGRTRKTAKPSCSSNPGAFCFRERT
ncbi:hypothetical protein ACIRRT_03980 [Streptomyces sp. NPDC102256]|uniref:hypothetical protein n=1 Tax=Streptomyces sp. NPDC102256 TaxID=3366147 RepID=UPI0037F55176